jgi:uncharacterized protein YcfJ
MKTITLIIPAMLLASASWAHESLVRIINIQPRYQTTLQQKCHTEIVESNNGTLGLVIGGVAGGIIGNQVGNGSGRDAATVIGTVIGAGVGNRIGEDQRTQQTRNVCNTVPITVRRGENVTFEYQGRRFTVAFED